MRNIFLLITVFQIILINSVFCSEKADDKDVSIGTVEDGVSIVDLTSDGRRSWELHGVSAKFVADGYVEIKNVSTVIYPQSAKSEEDKVIISAPSARINQSKKLVKTDEPVTITSKETVVTGIGLDANMNLKEARIKKNVKMLLLGDRKSIFFKQS